jgi:hypothetical protein
VNWTEAFAEARKAGGAVEKRLPPEDFAKALRDLERAMPGLERGDARHQDACRYGMVEWWDEEGASVRVVRVDGVYDRATFRPASEVVKDHPELLGSSSGDPIDYTDDHQRHLAAHLEVNPPTPEEVRRMEASLEEFRRLHPVLSGVAGSTYHIPPESTPQPAREPPGLPPIPPDPVIVVDPAVKDGEAARLNPSEFLASKAKPTKPSKKGKR